MRRFRTVIRYLSSPQYAEASINSSSSHIYGAVSEPFTHTLRQLSTSSFLSSASTIADALPTDTAPDELELAARGEVTDNDEPDLKGISLGAAYRRTDALASLPQGDSINSKLNFFGREWSFETGRLARLADGACVVRVGGTTVLATASSDANSSRFRRELSRDPIIDVDYREKLYAVGRIPGTYNKREGMPKEHEMLAARRIERSLRPLLPRGLMVDTEIMANILSADGIDDPEVVAIIASSAALTCSTIPWSGPVGAVRVARCNNQLVVSPTPAQLESADVNILVVGAVDRVVMLEMTGSGMTEEELISAVKLGLQATKQQIEPQLELARQTKRQTRHVQLAGADPAAARRMAEVARMAVKEVLRDTELDRVSRTQALSELRSVLEERMRAAGCWRAEFSRVAGSGCVAPSDLEHTLAAAIGSELRALALEEGLRPDGRGAMDLRPATFGTDHVPVVHGSALVDAGETQALCTVTVGGRSEQQRSETLLGGEDVKRLFVHYSLPPYSTPAGREGRVSSIIRTELDRSALIERALLPVLPPENATPAFPFAFRINVDALGPDGGSTMASVGGGCLAMIDAGVPLKDLCAGVSIALLAESGWNGESGNVGGWPVGQQPSKSQASPSVFEILTDPTALEASAADAELRVAGTSSRITACQLEVKLEGGVPLEAIEAAFKQGLVARLRLLEAMKSAVPKTRHSHAPVFDSIQVPASLVGKVIGREGSNLRDIESSTGARIAIGDGGLLHVFAPSQEHFERAKHSLLASIGENVRAGERYTAKVVAIKEFGAFVSIPGTEIQPLLHISEVAPTRIRAVEDVLKVGQEVEVVCLGRDHRGTIRVSRKAALPPGDRQQNAGGEEEKTQQ